MWKVGMQGEGEGAILLNEGEHVAEIKEVRLVSAEESKSGNPYFFWKLKTESGSIDVRTTLIKGKRWLLKQILLACGIQADEKDPEEKYVFDEKDVMGKKIIINVVNRESSFTGRDGKTVTNTKSEVNRIKLYVVEAKENHDKIPPPPNYVTDYPEEPPF